MMDYDNTDRGSFFKPRADESLLVQGKLNSNGDEHRIVIIKASLPDGGTARDVYAKIGTMYENDKSQNEKSPDFSGPVQLPNQEKRRIACWKTVSNDGNTKFLSARIGDRTPRIGEDTVSINNNDDMEAIDEVPF
jgi:hypothetical protein